MKLSIIIPVYNEEKTVLQLLDKVKKVNFPGVEKEIIIVNDGSTDSSTIKIKEYIRQAPNLTHLQHKKNQGKGAAVRTGIKKATGDYIVIQDADLEYNPKEIGKLIKPIKRGEAQIVYGTRINRLPNLLRDERTPLFLLHYIGNRSLSLFTSIFYLQWITDMETCYKMFPSSAVEGMQLHARGFEFEPEITAKFLKKGYRIHEVSITTIPRSYKEGKKINTVRDGFFALVTLIKYRFID